MALPHVTLGYWGTQRVPPLLEALTPYRDVEPLKLRVSRVMFTIYTRGADALDRHVLQTADEEIIAEYHLEESATG